MAVDRNAADKLRLRRNAQREAVDHGGTNLTYKGTWSSGTTYHKKDVVSLNGSSYVAIASSTNQTPPNTSYWAVLSAKGDDGTSFVWEGTWPGPVYVVTDDFNRANSLTTIGTATTGQVWHNDAGTWGISSNKAYCASIAAVPGNNSSATVESGFSDGTISVTISTVSSGNGLVIRADAATPGDNHVLIYSDGSTISIFEKVGPNSYSGLATTPATISYTPVNGDVLSVVFSGSFLEVSVNGVVKGVTTSLLYPTNTRHGLYADNSTVRYDTFSIARLLGVYFLDEVVARNGSSYIALKQTTAGDTPEFSPTVWALMAEKGDTGATGATGPSAVTTKGDLATFSTVVTRLPVGSNNQIIVADSTATTGLKWISSVSSALTFSNTGAFIALADTSLLVSLGLKVQLATSGGLELNTGVQVKGHKVVSSDPGSPADGDAWYNSTSTTYKVREAGITGLQSAILFNAAAGTAITNTTVEGDFGTSTTLPANFLKAGRQIRLTAGGSYSYAGAAGTLVLGGRMGSAADGVTIAAASLASSGRWYIEQTFSVSSTGVSGSILESGFIYIEEAASIAVIVLGTGSPTTDTTGTNVAKVVASWSVANAGNTINTRFSRIEVIG